MNTETRTIGPVTQGALKGGGAAGAITVLLVWVASLLGLDVPEPVAAAVTLLISLGGTAFGGWLVWPGSGQRVDRG